MDGEEDDSGWDGPNIRPPQLSLESRSRSSGGDRRYHAGHRSSGGSGSHRRTDHAQGRSHGASSSRAGKSRQEHRNPRDYHYRPDGKSVRDRLGPHPNAKNLSNERHSSSRDRDKDRSGKSRSLRESSAEKELRLKKFMSAAVSDKSRRDAEIRKELQEVERKMKAEKEKEKEKEKERRKREHSREKTDSSAQKHRKKDKAEDKKSKPVPAKIEVSSEEEEEEDEQETNKDDEDTDDNESAESENASASESGSEEEEESESGEVESTSESSEDDTGSEQSGVTPVHEDEEEAELEEIAAQVDEKTKPEKEKSKYSSESLTSSDEERMSRTPSKSPTPRRKSEDEDTTEAKVLKSNQEDSPRSRGSFADDIPDEDGDKDERNLESEAEDVDSKLPPYLPSVYGCRSVEEFQCLNRVEEGTYGVVYRAKDKKSNKIVALKRLKMEREKEGFPITSLREINTLLISQHPNVVTVREIVVGSNMDKIYIVMDFVEHDLKSLMETMREKKQVFLPGEVKCLMQQLLRAIAYLHDNWILHRDLKTSNLLLSHNGILKVGDFGLAREYGSPLKQYTSVVVTLWYRAPELLLGIKEYSTHIDVWSIGCIFGELLLMEPLFTGKSDQDQLSIIFKLLGTPNEKIWTGFNKLPVVQKAALPDVPPTNLRIKFPKEMLSELGLGLLKKFLTYDPKKRISCDEALAAEYFIENPRPIDPSMFPTWPAKSELSAGQVKKGASPKPPSGGGAFKKINEDEDEYAKYTGFVLNPGKSAAPAPWNLKF